MNASVFRHALRQSRKTIIVLSAACAGFYYLVLVSASSFLNGTTGVGFLRTPPRAIEAFLGGSADFLHPPGWLAAGMTHPVTLALLSSAALVVAAGAVASEVERGTVELVLARPVGRRPFLLAKAAAAAVTVTTVEAGGLAGVLLARTTISSMADLPLGNVLLAFLASWVLFLALAMVALLASARTSLRGRALGVAIGVVVGSFFLNFIALLIDGISPLRYGSVFHYFRPGDVISGRSFGADLAVLAGVGGAALAGSMWAMARRDLTR